MKKTLLITALALAGGSAAMALPTAPELYDNQYILAVSPDGRYVTSEIMGRVIITDRETATEYRYEDGEGYSVGSGNAWSNNGIMVGSTDVNGDAAYWQNGEWKVLPNPEGRSVFMTCISPDGRVAVGVGSVVAADNTPEGTTHLPMVWTLGENGKWGEPEVLSCPTLDFTGRAPQGAFPQYISNDGNTISVQFMDYSGYFIQPMMYTKGTDGKWAYSNFGGTILNPNNLEFPEYPEEAPVDPASHVTDYIKDADKLAEYQAAMAEWMNDFSLPYPQATDYMSEEELAVYDEDVLKFNQEAEEYNAKLMAFLDVFDKMYDDCVMITYNNNMMTGDASMVLSTQTRSYMPDPEDPWTIEDYSEPIILRADSHTAYPVTDKNQAVSSALAADGTIIAYSDEANRQAFIKRPNGEWQSLYDFLVANTEESAHEWLKENILHTFDSMDYITGESVSFVDAPMLGVSTCTPDLSVITANAINTWDFENDPVEYYSYVVPTPKATVGLNAVGNDSTFNVKALAGGVIVLNEAADVKVFDMAGRLVFKANGVSGTISTGLNAGIYTVKAVSGNSTKVVKTRF